MQFWAPAVYILCLLTSAACAWLLVKSFGKNRTPLLLWSAACFVLLALNHLFVVIDLIVLPTEIDLQLIRNLSLVAGVLTLLYGFIWELD
jgi:hypothetical protein